MTITPQAYNVNEEYVDNFLICWSYDTPSRSTTILLQALICLIIYGVLVNMLLVNSEFIYNKLIGGGGMPPLKKTLIKYVSM